MAKKKSVKSVRPEFMFNAVATITAVGDTADEAQSNLQAKAKELIESTGLDEVTTIEDPMDKDEVEYIQKTLGVDEDRAIALCRTHGDAYFLEDLSNFAVLTEDNKILHFDNLSEVVGKVTWDDNDDTIILINDPDESGIEVLDVKGFRAWYRTFLMNRFSISRKLAETIIENGDYLPTDTDENVIIFADGTVEAYEDNEELNQRLSKGEKVSAVFACAELLNKDEIKELIKEIKEAKAG